MRKLPDLLVRLLQVLHEHGHHHVYQYKLSREHKRHKIHGGDELQSGVAARAAAWALRWALPQCVLAAKEGRKEGG